MNSKLLHPRTSLTQLVLESLANLGPRLTTYFAIFFFLMSFGLIGYLVFSNVPDENKFYAENLQKYQANQDEKNINLCLEALLALQPDNLAIRYQYARFLENRKQYADARILLEGLTSLEEDAVGLDEAYWLVGKRTWISREGDQEKSDLAMKYLKKAVELNPKNEVFQADLGTALFESGKFIESYKHVLNGVRVRPELAVALSEKIVLKDKKLAIDLLQAAENPIINKLKTEPGNEFNIRTLALMQVLRGKLPEAIDILQSTYKETSSPALKKELGDVIAKQITNILQKPPVELQQVIPLLDKGLAIDPNNGALFGAMESLMGLNSEAKKTIQEKLNQLLSKGISIALVHFLLGSEAHRAGHADLARLHYELAFRANPGISDLCNNLAWYMANESPRDPEKAMALINQAIQMQPSIPNYYDTRGQIQVLLGNWKEGVADLEKALSGMGTNPSTHKGLAKCYEKLGMKDLAEIHLAKSKKNDEPQKIPTNTRRKP